MKPLDPRLLRYARASRRVLALGAALGLARTLAILAWCWCLAHAIVVVALPALVGEGGGDGRVAEGAPDAGALPALLVGATLAFAVRSACSWGMDAVAARGAITVKTQLRAAALDTLDRRSPVGLAAAGAPDRGRSEAEAATVLARGLDALDGYFSAYLPQLILTAVATPPLILAVLLADPLSGVIVVIVFPVIPVFMILIGLATQAVQHRQWDQLQKLSASFVDAVAGLATLKIFRRESRQSIRIMRETEEYRSRTMRVLRVTFLSGFVLDLAGTFSIALVAVTVGTRLVGGEFSLGLGLFVLLLLPEVFVPIRQVGTAFHASTEGLAAAGRVFDIIEAEPQANPETEPEASRAHAANGIRASGLVIARDGAPVAEPATFAVAPGEIVVLAGPSGAGKSTIIAALLGFLPPSGGTLAVPGVVAWAGQQPGLMQGSVAANVALGHDTPDTARVARALDAAGAGEIDQNTRLGAFGTGLSGGQAQRVAVARALYRAWDDPGSAILLDEPSSALDARHEAAIAVAIRREADAGRSVLVASHREALLAAADRVVHVEPVRTPAAHPATQTSGGGTA